MDMVVYALCKGADKKLQAQIDKITSIGRNLDYWDCTTGQPTAFPQTIPYAYQNGDYYLVKTVATSGTNYKPSGSSYTGAASTVVETETVNTFDMYRYNGTIWELLNMGQIYVATSRQELTDAQKAIARANIESYTNTIIY